jgi:hypothetical protein
MDSDRYFSATPEQKKEMIKREVEEAKARYESQRKLDILRAKILLKDEEERPYREMLKQKKATFKKLKRNPMETLH